MPQMQNFTGNESHFIAPFEVVQHNQATDCWVSFLGKVYNLTGLLKKHEGQLCIRPIIVSAGKDISHWFDAKTGELQHYVHPITGVLEPYCPHGRLPDVNYQVPSSAWEPLDGKSWWKDDEKYLVGYLTKRVRPIRIINTLICKEVYMNVCSEDTFKRIMERYSVFNEDADSYTWRYDGRDLDMDKTMEENGIIDERDALTDIGLPQNLYVPGILLYYNDDMRHAESDDSEIENPDACIDIVPPKLPPKKKRKKKKLK